MVDVEAGQWVCGEGSFPDFVKLEVGHFGVGGVFDGGNSFSIDDVISDLAEEDAMGTDVFFGAVGGNGLGYELRGDRAIDENFLWFLFGHDEIKSTDTSHANTNPDKWLDHRILFFNAI